ncbi:MAG TPA: damage-inducible protein CinA [Lachnospiraceae bacterium]|nr:damage-inducible protein CinA [Lachnospiraceae bacterium]
MSHKEDKKEKSLDKLLEKELKRNAQEERKKDRVDAVKEDKDFESYEQVFKLCGIPVGEVKNLTADLREGENPRMRFDSVNGEVHIRVSAVRENDKSAKKVAKPVVKELKSRFSERIYSLEEDGNLAVTVYELLRDNSLTLSAAESCTGGLICSRLVDIPGASEVLKEGFVVYSNKAKRARLGVKKSTLLKYGAVSEETVKEMLKGCAFFAKTDVSVAVSGIAGPDGGTEEKPVGTVFVGCAIKGKTMIRECHFKGNRNEVREQAVTEALALIRLCVLKYYSEKNFNN